MIEPTDQDIEAARAAAKSDKLHRTTTEVEGDTLRTIFQKPTRAEFHRYIDAVSAPGAKSAAVSRAQETFVLSCTLWPDAKELKKLFEDNYTLATQLADEALKVAAGAAKATTEGL